MLASQLHQKLTPLGGYIKLNMCNESHGYKISNPDYAFRIISHKYKYIYFEIPKCATTSIKRVIFLQNLGEPLSPRHDVWIRRAPELLLIDDPRSEKYRKYFKFAVVRNPWDRVVSAYSNKRQVLEKYYPKGQTDISFDEFVGMIQIYRNHHWIPCSEFITDREGRVDLDYIIKFEELDEGIKKLSDYINLDIPLEKKNQSDRGAYRDYYSDRTENLVRKMFALDIELFGYRF